MHFGSRLVFDRDGDAVRHTATAIRRATRRRTRPTIWARSCASRRTAAHRRTIPSLPAGGRRSGPSATATCRGRRSIPRRASYGRPSTAPAAAMRSTSPRRARTTAGRSSLMAATIQARGSARARPRPGWSSRSITGTRRSAPSGAAFYTGDLFPGWKGNFLVGALAGQALHRLVLEASRWWRGGLAQGPRADQRRAAGSGRRGVAADGRSAGRSAAGRAGRAVRPEIGSINLTLGSDPAIFRPIQPARSTRAATCSMASRPAQGSTPASEGSPAGASAFGRSDRWKRGWRDDAEDLGRRTSVNVQKAMWTVGELGLPHERVDRRRVRRPGHAGVPALNPNRLVPTIDDRASRCGNRTRSCAIWPGSTETARSPSEEQTYAKAEAGWTGR